MNELDVMLAAIPAGEREIVVALWADRERYVRWPLAAGLLMSGVRDKYHAYSDEVRARAKAAKVSLDSRSNGPAIMSYQLAGGERPARHKPGRGWHIHHIYDGQYPWPGKTTSAHAVKDKDLFSEAAGLVAIHPLLDAAADEYAWVAWQLRLAAFLRFGFDPDGVLRDFAGRSVHAD